MSTTTAPLRSLLFTWGPEQANDLEKDKEFFSTAPVLSYFDSTISSTIQADTSQHSLGACLLQRGNPTACHVPPEVLAQQRAIMLKLKRNCWL